MGVLDSVRRTGKQPDLISSMRSNATDTKLPSVFYLTRFGKSYLPLILLSLGLLIGGRTLVSIQPIWLKKVIDGIADHSAFAVILTFLGVYFLLSLGQIVLDFFRDFVFAPVQQGISTRMAEALYTHLLDLPVAYHHEQKLGALSKRLTRGSRAFAFMMDIVVLTLLPTFVELVIVTTLLLRLYAPIYALVTLGSVVAYTIFTVWATEKRQRWRLAANEAEDAVSSHEIDSVGNIDTVKYFNNEPWLKKQYHPLIGTWHTANVTSNRVFALVAGGQGLILAIGMGITLYLAVQQSGKGILTVGDLVLLSAYIVRLTAPITTLGFIYRGLKDNYTDLQGISKILQEEVTIKEPTEPQVIETVKGDVCFDHVSFSYETDRRILNDVNLDIKPGMRVAFVGPSGSGKSTIVKLLFRFFEPTSGNILIDGVPLNRLSKEARHDIFAIVPQEPSLFNDTIAANIRFGKPDATVQEIEDAARLANIHNFISGLPAKYDTVVGERGVKLSGGEKQRVAIARAILRNPKVLVFDEATSSLDSTNEKEIQEALDKIARGRTTIAVAHRLSTIANSDIIYVLGNGGIAEQGTHHELLEKEGAYARLWRTQISHKREHEKSTEDLLAAV
jgi:ABC-type transport system involved in Fe-S cluster assembly fused permease/ATPase subunit